MIADTSQAQKDLATQKDRITALLTKQAGNQSFGQDASDIGQSFLSALSTNTGAAGFEQSYGNIKNQRNEAQSNLYKMMQDEVAQGNEDAAHVDKTIKDVVGENPKAYEAIANELHNMPEQVNRSNATMAVTKAANKLGIKSFGLEKQNLGMEDLRATTSLHRAQANYYNNRGTSGRNSNIDPTLARQVDKDVIINNRKVADSANDSLRTLAQIEDSLKGANTGKVNSALEFVGQAVPFVNSSQYQDVKSKSTKLSLDVSSMLKGASSDKDVAKSLETAPSYDKDPEANAKIIKDQRAALTVVSEMPKFTSMWTNRYGSTLGVDENGKTYDEAFLDWQKNRFKELGGNGEANNQQNNNSEDPSEEDINFTAKKHGLTPDEVRRRLKK